MPGHMEMQNATTIMSDHEEAVENAEGNGGNSLFCSTSNTQGHQLSLPIRRRVAVQEVRTGPR